MSLQSTKSFTKQFRTLTLKHMFELVLCQLDNKKKTCLKCLNQLLSLMLLFNIYQHHQSLSHASKIIISYYLFNYWTIAPITIYNSFTINRGSSISCFQYCRQYCCYLMWLSLFCLTIPKNSKEFGYNHLQKQSSWVHNSLI